MTNQTMHTLSYGLSKPYDLLEKMKYDGSKIKPEFNPYDIFNFIVTAAALNDWIIKYYKDQIGDELKEAIYFNGKNNGKIDGFPKDTLEWIKDVSNIPNIDFDLRIQIQDCIQICNHVCNASKHFNWNDTRITSIEEEPIVKNWYQYHFSKCEPGIYIEYNEIHYCITQVRDILIQFYTGLILFFENQKSANANI